MSVKNNAIQNGLLTMFFFKMHRKKTRKKKHPLLAEPSLDVELMGDSSDAFGITQIHLRVFIYW